VIDVDGIWISVGIVLVLGLLALGAWMDW